MDVSFERLAEGKDEWLTPPELIHAIGPFDLDPCSPKNKPWPTALEHYTIDDDGLTKDWNGLVFCNPPYGSQTGVWLKKCANHNNCIALTFARTETKMFHDCVWNKAKSIFFFKGRLSFYHVSGIKGGTAGAPSVLISYGDYAHERLVSASKKLNGKLVCL